MGEVRVFFPTVSPTVRAWLDRIPRMVDVDPDEADDGVDDDDDGAA